MPQGPYVFVDVDTQRDFLDHRGSVVAPNAPAIMPNLARLTTFARERDVPILATACAHLPDDPDPAEELPEHCIAETKGAERIEATRWPGSLVLLPDAEFRPAAHGGAPAHLVIMKRRLDPFTHPEADRVFEFYSQLDDHITFVVYGVAADTGVAAVVRGLTGRNYTVAVVTDALATLDPSKADAAHQELQAAGAELVTTDAICGPA